VTSQFIAAAASVALLGAGFSAVDGTRSTESLPMNAVSLAQGDAAGGNRCRVDVIRAAPAGAAAITRHVLTDGSCVCTVTTGPAGGNGGAENIVTNLLRDRTCNGAPAPGRPVAEAATGTTGGGGSVILPVLIGTVGAAGLAVALGQDSKG
jgi:hypothetical protein